MKQTTYVRAGDIQFDESYQRIDGISRARVNDIAKNFDPLIVGVIEISKRDDGSLFCVDGMHRVHGCIARFGPDYQMLAIVNTGLTSFDEARMFERQTKRTAVSTFDRHRARVASNDARATAIGSILGDFGIRVVRNRGAKRTIRAIGTIEGIYVSHGQEVLREAIGIMDEADLLDHPNGINGTVLTAIANAVKAYGSMWHRPTLVRKLRQQDYESILREQVAIHKILGGNRNLLGAKAIATIYNRGLQEKRKLPL